MPTVQVTEANFDETVRQGIVLLDFWAGWCGPCRTFGPIFGAGSERHTGVVFGKVDVESQGGLAAAFEIQSIPTIVVLRDGVVLAMLRGVLSGRGLDELIGRVRAIDMEEVRRRLEASATEPDEATAGGV